MKKHDVRVVRMPGGKILQAFLNRPAFSRQAEDIARRVLSDVKARGGIAVCAWAKRFDGALMTPASLRVRPVDFKYARRSVDISFKKAVEIVIRRITRFSMAGIKKSWKIRTGGGGVLGERYMPLERVGIYVPGGAAPLASTALMTATIARVAGVKEIVACTPAGKDGHINPYLLYALEASGTTEVYRVGGVQAIGMMAYGTNDVRKVQKIVGPGGTFVTAAKKQVYGDVALDMVAGPSEIAVLADKEADPRFLAADLLSQAEHGTGWEKALLVTTSMSLALSAREELVKQAGLLGRKTAIHKVMKQGMLIVVVKNLFEGVELCNRFAPEHMEVICRNPVKWAEKIRCAGAVFVGKWTPESAGDFVAGPSHVLPTGGAAAMFSGLSVDDFRRRSSYILFKRDDLRQTLPVIKEFGRVEGLDAHVRSAQIRFERK